MTLALAAPILLISPDGMLGTAMSRELSARGLEHDEVVYPDIDLTDQLSVERAIGAGTATVINCAAFTDVDAAEVHEAEALAVNGDGVAILAARCAGVGATLVHFSTDYVFDGAATAPYPVTHPRDPINAYGRTKAAGEAHLEASAGEWLLVRTSWLYAPWARNFVRTIAGLAGSRSALRVVDDQRGRPTSAEHLAGTTLALLERGERGTFHVTDGGECSWFDFAVQIAAHVNPECRVEPCTSADFPRPARRPGYSVLELAKTEALVGPMTPWSSSLAAVLERLESAGGVAS